MPLPNIFERETTEQVIRRIQQLTPDSRPGWGKMAVAQMLAHCSVTYELVYENKHPEPGAFVKFMLKAFVKKSVVGENPYKPNSRTAPAFLIQGSRKFEAERNRLIDYVDRTQRLGEAAFHNKVSHSFGPLSATEWNNMFYKHLDHHLRQFGV